MFLLLATILQACKEIITPETAFEDYPTTFDENLWPDYSEDHTEFNLWSPPAEEVRINLYLNGSEGDPFEQHFMRKENRGTWRKIITGDLVGTYYTYQVKIDGEWLEETPGIYAQAVGVNGKRAMVVNLATTNPENWHMDRRPVLNYPNEAIIYELHVRDITSHPNSGSSMPGKYLGLVEEGTIGPGGLATGIDHMKELGITHVHLLPSYDHYSIDESRLDSAQFNWGYDPQNYNVPEGSFSNNPEHGDVRIKEFKSMVKAFHDNGIGVILDVVYNHTGRTENSNFNLEVPGYYYRQWPDGKWSDASACGNETASERAMMRRYILESVKYWAEEYHMDGFRFDLMGIHDISLMNEVAETLKAIDPNIIIYGEGWTAGDSPLPEEERALKKHMQQIPLIAAFSDDIRDGLKGSVFDDSDSGFASGKPGMEESVKFGVVGSILHPQIEYEKVNYSDAPWANEPWQAISYVSCHDNHTLFDKLRVSRKDAKMEQIVSMHKLANAIVMTSQGIAFLHAGVELLRTKNGEHNSFESPDEINQIDWNRKKDNYDVFRYYKNLVELRKLHPAFRMTSSNDVKENLKFTASENGVIVYQIGNAANGDTWKDILVIYNARTEAFPVELEGNWNVGVLGDQFNFDGGEVVTDLIRVPAISMAILYKE